ncbi:RimK family alpha-L-glutamate ligase [Kitasatospora sp. NPDC056181]|uniref:ATP-grasp domain-containing protein n=1 Tax=Kitasatospora sp. NPDC056181 TaxID=3345737 RepID=UPI0035D7B5D3
MGTARIAVVTCRAYADLDPDLPLLVDALRAAGLAAEPVAWDAEAPGWERFDLAVVRSAWDYSERLGEFLAWADTTARATRLWNPAPVVRWNSDKRYLLELAGRGIPVAPTRILEPGGPFEQGDLDHPDGVVVKPAVSAGARDTARYLPGRAADAARHARMLLDQGRAVVVQPYLPLVAEGERALVFVDGDFSHAIRKGPVLTEPGVIDNLRTPHPDLVAHQPTGAELRTARAALAAAPSAEGLLYARVDLALDGAREPVVMELELIEPNLFLGYDPQGPERLVAAVAARAATGR